MSSTGGGETVFGETQRCQNPALGVEDEHRPLRSRDVGHAVALDAVIKQVGDVAVDIGEDAERAVDTAQEGVLCERAVSADALRLLDESVRGNRIDDHNSVQTSIGRVFTDPDIEFPWLSPDDFARTVERAKASLVPLSDFTR